MKKIFSLALLTVFFVSCQKEPDLSDMDGEFTVLTNFDVNADMSTASTFYIPDSILLIGSDSENPTYWTGINASNLVSEFVTNMEEFGYTRSTDKADADLGLQVSYIENDHYFADFFTPSWWWGYPGYWDPFYWGIGWGGWYNPIPVVYQYRTGSMIVEMVDLRKSSEELEDHRLPILWTAYMTGLLSGYNRFDEALTIDAINQAFSQTEGLKK